MLPFLISAAIAAAAQPPVSDRAEARTRILLPVTGTKIDWDRAPARQRREIVREDNGHKTVIRVIDYE